MSSGEAVAIGVAIDCVYSSLWLGFPAEQCRRVLECLGRMGFELSHPLLQQRRAVFDGLEESARISAAA